MYKFNTVFTKDLANSQLISERRFNAPLALVWQAFTDAKLLDKWWAPLPWKTVTKSQDFSEGGRWLYYMQGPEGEQHWCLMDYLKIDHEVMFSGEDAFCDADGNISPEMPRTTLHIYFTTDGQTTKVKSVGQYASADDVEKIVEMGVVEGSSMAHQNLDDLLAELLKNA